MLALRKEQSLEAYVYVQSADEVIGLITGNEKKMVQYLQKLKSLPVAMGSLHGKVATQMA
jgi:hypothetical protein